MRNTMLGALAVLSAMFALPTFAPATPLHIEPTANFTVSGGVSTWSRAAGGGNTGTTVTGSGSFENTTTGTVTLVFHHVTTDPVPFTCTSPGQAAGTVETTKLPFHLVTLKNQKPGILVTSNTTLDANKQPIAGTTHFMDYTCGVFVGTVVVKGTGFLGTFTSPECGKSSNTATLSFKGANGVQEHTEDITGYKPALESSVGGGAYSTTAIQAHATITFAGGATPKLNCT